MADFLTTKQKEYLKEHAEELFKATMLPPNDNIETILQSNCPCCKDRKKFLQKLLEVK
jgi:hypothetical protein